MQIIKDGVISADETRHLADNEAAPTNGTFTVSLSRWLADKASLKATGAAIGVRLASSENPASLEDDLPNLALVVVEFPAMADGRGFSLARLLRQRHHYQGEIRAKGDFIRDQVYFLSRVGVNAFEPVAGTPLESLLPALKEFSVSYQASSDQTDPLYRKRS